MPICRTIGSSCPVCPADTPAGFHARGQDFEYGTTDATEWEFRCCDSCGTVFLDPRPDDSELARIYPSNYYAYDFTVKQSIGFRVKTQLDVRTARGYLARCPGDGNILDIGCGDGRLLRVLAGLGVAPSRLYGCDFDEKAIARGQAEGLNLQLGRFEEADLATGSFALVVLQQVIEHVSDPAAAMAKIMALLMPGGIVVLETPNVRSWDHALFARRHWGGYHIPRHFNLFTPDSLAELLRKNDFEVAETHYLLSPSFWIQSLHHTLLESSLLSPLRKLFHPQRPNALALALFSALDVLGKPFGWTSNMRLIARRSRAAAIEEAAPGRQGEFRKEGWILVEGQLESRVAECRDRFDEYWRSERDAMSIQYDDAGSQALVKLHQLEERDPVFRALANDSGLRAVVEELIGPAEIFRDVCVGKPPESRNELSYHQDAAYWDVEPDRLVSAWIALDDVPAASGCLRVIPRSHRSLLPHDLWIGTRRLPRIVTRLLRRAVSLTGTGDNPTSARERAFFRIKQLLLGPMTRLLPGAERLNDLSLDPAELPPQRPIDVSVRAGDVILFSGLLLHGSGPNTGETWRRGYIVSFAGI